MKKDGAYVDGVARRTKRVFILIELVTALIVTSGAIDCSFGLGWGYHWKDVAIGLGIMLWGGFVYLCCKGIFRFLGSGLSNT
ncbi:hypothetical protein ACUXST_001282 [Sphingomonas sp. F9_3S_D5_B_2]